MRRQITNSFLWQVQNDLLNLQQMMPGLAFILENRIASFFQRNQMNLKILNSRMHEIQKKFIVHNEKNTPQYEEVEEGKPKDWKYVESVAGKDGQLITGSQVKEEYQQQMEEFMQRTVTVEL